MEENRSGDCRFERSTERQSDRRTGIPPCFFVSVRSKGVANAFHGSVGKKGVALIMRELRVQMNAGGLVRECHAKYQPGMSTLVH